MNRFEVIEKAFKKAELIVDGKTVWNSIEREALENIDGEGEFEIREENMFENNKRIIGITYTISKTIIKNGEDDYLTEIKLLKITINGQIVFDSSKNLQG